MENIYLFATVLLGILLRIGIPVAITAILVYLFTRLDKHWQKEAERSQTVMTPALARNYGCWDINGCSEEAKKRCRAYANPDSPCWQVYRTKNGQLQERCLGCKVFKEAPVPVHA